MAGIGVSVRATVMSASCGKCKMVVPYSQLANGLKGAGFDNGTIYVHDYPTQVGGNLRPFFPNSRVASFKYNIYFDECHKIKVGQIS